jgi:GNAT superfamily N-acetyltransferase
VTSSTTTAVAAQTLTSPARPLTKGTAVFDEPSRRSALRPARPAEAAQLSAVAIRSKAYWGYDAEFMAACRDDLAVRPEECDGQRVVVAVRGEEIVGFYQLDGSPPSGELADLFVDPACIGSGVGGVLYRDALTRARRLGYQELTIDADPHAEDFYRHMGAVRVGLAPSTAIPGRLLPQLRVVL